MSAADNTQPSAQPTEPTSTQKVELSLAEFLYVIEQEIVEL
jgi:hypothetical protein